MKTKEIKPYYIVITHELLESGNIFVNVLLQKVISKYEEDFHFSKNCIVSYFNEKFTIYDDEDDFKDSHPHFYFKSSRLTHKEWKENIYDIYYTEIIDTSKKQEYDFIKPQHYKLWKDNNDVNNVIKASLTKEEYIGFLKGNILKYQLRLGKKPGESIERDQNKIKWYQEQLNDIK